MLLGTIIRELREKKGISQVELGEQIRKSQARISDLENNKAVPDWLEMQALARVLEVSITDFLTEDLDLQSQPLNPTQGGILFVHTFNYNSSQEPDFNLVDSINKLSQRIKYIESNLNLIAQQFANKPNS